MICSVCSNPLDLDDRFCNLCGMPVMKPVENKATAAPLVAPNNTPPGVCSKCGAELPAGALFCGKCHTVVKKNAAPCIRQTYCHSCGAVLKAGEKFCGYCGAKA